MKVKSGISIILVCVLIWISNCTAFSSAETDSITTLNVGSKDLNIYSTIAIKDSIVYNGKTQNLYPVFNDRQVALAKLLDDNDNITVLTEIQTENNLSPLDEENWEQYYEAIMSYQPDANQLTAAQMDAVNTLLKFFDIFENDEKNQ